MHAAPVAPVNGTDAPCEEHVQLGEDVDLERFPVPLPHQEDGGRYFGTYGFHGVASPDGTWTSWSVSRTVLHGRNTLVGPAMPQQHLGMIHAMWRERGRPGLSALLQPPPAPPASAPHLSTAYPTSRNRTTSRGERDSF